MFMLSCPQGLITDLKYSLETALAGATMEPRQQQDTKPLILVGNALFL